MRRKKAISKVVTTIRDFIVFFTPAGNRGRVLIICLVASITIVVLTASFVKEAWLNTVGLSVSSSGVAATLVEIMVQITAKLEQSLKKRKFLTIFGCSNEHNRIDESTTIIIPAFDIKRLDAHSLTVNGDELKLRATENLSRTDTKAAIKNDILAGSFITSMFAKVGLHTPGISWDEENIDYSNNRKETYILIGLSNRQLDVLRNENTLGKYFSVETIKEIDGSNSFVIRLKRVNDYSSQLPDDQYPNLSPSLNSPSNLEYAVFAKFTCGSKTIIVCGGTTEAATNNIAQYIHNYWERIYSEIKDKKETPLLPFDPFAVIVQTSSGSAIRDIKIADVRT
ncbi:MAG TPA: hypothetical protein VK203_27840 [Nostocaceae cyanobacterium]|nr:hypothetical protein [Nostocaceae cyanobacterium]